MALAESHTDSRVGNGENSGRLLRHVAVVRALVPAGTVKAGGSFSKQVSVAIPGGANKGGWRVVPFVQGKRPTNATLTGVVEVVKGAARPRRRE